MICTHARMHAWLDVQANEWNYIHTTCIGIGIYDVVRYERKAGGCVRYQ